MEHPCRWVKKKDNNRSTGRGTICFKSYNEMDALLGANHDVEFPVIGTSEGIQIRRPDLVNEGGQPAHLHRVA